MGHDFLKSQVLLCDWNEALREKVVFGTNQALIFCSTNDEKNIHGVFSEWLNDHPFILTPLDSKGLEFDDVVVGFDVERKAWNINSDRISSLRLLREL